MSDGGQQPLRTQSTDTHPKAEKVQIQLLRQAGLSGRLELARSLSLSTIEMSRNAIRKRYPEMSELQTLLRFVAFCYGQSLAERLEHCIKQRTR